MNYQPFIKDILANPQDDAPRLVYADWLEGQGDPRSEFIRLQIRREQLPFDDSEAVQSRRREQALLRKHGKAWAGPISQFTAKYRFRRGFVEMLEAPLKTFLERSDEIFAVAPVCALGLRQCSDERIRELANHKALQRLSTLSLSKCTMGVDAFEALVTSEHLGNIGMFEIDQTEFTVPMSAALTKSVFAKQLRALRVSSLNAITPSSVDVKKLLKAVPQLQYLDITGCELSGDDIESITKANLRQLRYLEIPGEEAGEAGIDAVLMSNRLKNLRWLECDSAQNPVRFARDMNVSLERLGLFRSALTNHDAATLFNSEYLAGLTHLHLIYSKLLTSGCVKELIRSPMFANLACLRISFFKMMSKSAFENLVAAWKEMERPVGNLSLPVIDLPHSAAKEIKKRYGKDSFVDLHADSDNDCLTIPCGVLRPEEHAVDVIDSWKAS